jgi:uncharacterized protein (TIGR00730 family)
MKKPVIPDQINQQTYPSASKGVADASRHIASDQTRSPTYPLAFADDAFLQRDEMRGVRLQLEFEKPDLFQRLQQIESTLVVFGGSRIVEESKARVLVEKAEADFRDQPADPAIQARLATTRRHLANAKYYHEARELARLASTTCMVSGQCHFVVTTGGGPGIMEAANRGAHEAGAKSIGLNIVLPVEQEPNPYITPELCFQFHYFALRKMHFLLRAKALVCFPGGFGTMDELFNALTLIQTRKIAPIPVLLVGHDYWKKALDFEFLADEGLVAAEDLQLFRMVDSAQEAWDHICKFHSITFE